VPFPKEGLECIGTAFHVHYVPDTADFESRIGQWAETAHAIVTNGTVGLSAHHISAFNGLELIVTRGAGYENVDLEAARARGIPVANTPGVNAASVADHAMALVLGLLRDVRRADHAVRTGRWGDREGWIRPILFRKRMGIVGLGSIGHEIARRASGFDVEIGYCSRSPKPDVPYTFHKSVEALATASDILIVCCPANESTYHLIDAGVLEKLGSGGYLINVARGSIVDTAALVRALEENRIAGAALDVVEGQPKVPQALLDAPNVLLTPHVAARAPEVGEIVGERILVTLQSHFEGRPLAARVY
jgi:lactate dehydrogenase-like 2-hydroxyacid dehydrogenase